MDAVSRDRLVAAAILIGLIGAWGLLAFRPQYRELRRLRDQNLARQAAITKDIQKIGGLAELTRQVEEMRKRYQDFDRRLPKRKELSEFLAQISWNRDQEGLDNEIFQPGNPTKEDLFHTLPIIMRFQGSFLSLTNFMKRMETTERLTRTKRLTIASGGGKSLDIELHMNIYFTES